MKEAVGVLLLAKVVLAALVGGGGRLACTCASHELGRKEGGRVLVWCAGRLGLGSG